MMTRTRFSTLSPRAILRSLLGGDGVDLFGDMTFIYCVDRRMERWKVVGLYEVAKAQEEGIHADGQEWKIDRGGGKD